MCVGQPGAGNQPKAVLATPDLGKTWSLRARTSPPGGRGHCLSSFGYGQGLAFHGDGNGALWESRGSGLLLTGDGGRSWCSPGAPTRAEIDFGQSVSAFSPRGYFLLVYNTAFTAPKGRIRLLVSRDDGAHWRVVHRWR